MKRPSQRSLQKATPILVVAAALLLVYAPTAIGLSSGASKDSVSDPHWADEGCTLCHGDHSYAPTGPDVVTYSIMDADGNVPGGMIYGHEETYTITITLDEQNEPGATNHAGFNIRASVGTLAGVEGESQASGDGMEATHVDASRTSWTVTWTSPAEDEGAAVFDIWVNDVDGSAAPDETDHVYRDGFFMFDASGLAPGAAEPEHEVHYGVSLPQYWLGLIALAMTAVLILFGFVYLKYVSPHNTDQKDR